MRKGREHFLNDSIRENESLWRLRDVLINKLLGESDRLASEDPALGKEMLFATITRERRLYRRLLLSRFGYKVPRIALDLPMDITKGRVVRPERSPRNGQENVPYIIALSEWAAREAAFYYMLAATANASGLDKVTYPTLKKFAWRGMRMARAYAGTLIAILNHANGIADDVVIKEGEIAWFSGWVAPQISLWQNGRLQRALKEEHDSARFGLMEELPATVYIELENLKQFGGQLSALVNRVTQHLAKMGQRPLPVKQQAKLEALYRPDLQPGDPLSQEFLTKAEVEALIASANLPVRQYQTLALRLEEDLPYREIADKLGIDLVTVKTHMRRVHQTLRQAHEQRREAAGQ